MWKADQRGEPAAKSPITLTFARDSETLEQIDRRVDPLVVPLERPLIEGLIED